LDLLCLGCWHLLKDVEPNKHEPHQQSRNHAPNNLPELAKDEIHFLLPDPVMRRFDLGKTIVKKICFLFSDNAGMSAVVLSPSRLEPETLAKSDQNLVWIDCEMTGLDPEKERLLEIAVIVTGPLLTPRIEGPVLVIHQSDELLGKMDAWNKGTHGRSGLIDKVKASTITEAEAQEQILDFIKKYVPKSASPLCGNTISQDRRFLVKFMPKLEAYFHYRNLDVSTLKELSRRWKPEVYSAFKKQQRHTALADVHESIDELEHYREHFIRL
jgi:oligoribonuclease